MIINALRTPVLALGLLAVAVPSLAAEIPPPPPAERSSVQEADPVTVETPYTVHRKTVRRGGHLTEEVVSLSIRVSYSDLDLTRYKDTLELEKRVSDAAKEACRQVHILEPLHDRHTSRRSERACVRDAYGKAMPQATAAIQAANS